VATILVPVVAIQVVRAGKEEGVKRRPESSRWQAADGDLTVSVEPVELAPDPIVDSPPEVEPPPAPIQATANSLPAVEARAITPLPEPGSPPDKNAGAKVAVHPKKASGAHKKAAPAEPVTVVASGENRLFTLELSGTLGGEELDPEDSQTWARLSYFLREEARRPHFLVYPDGSIPLSVPAAPDGKARRTGPRVEVPEPAEGEQPAYRLVVAASAGKGAGVTFYGQRLASTYRARVSCRIEKRGDGETWKLVRHLTADESINTDGSGAKAGALVRRVYDACFQKLLGQLASQPPFAAAITTR
jgi:hypothetical protein